MLARYGLRRMGSNVRRPADRSGAVDPAASDTEGLVKAMPVLDVRTIERLADLICDCDLNGPNARSVRQPQRFLEGAGWDGALRRVLAEPSPAGFRLELPVTHGSRMPAADIDSNAALEEYLDRVEQRPVPG
jgi:hypothetical protein